MERDDHTNPLDLIDLGSVSGETKGNSAPHWEAFGLRSFAGISDE
jgi:hypothetical protein